MYRKETFASHTANDAVHLYNRRFRIISQILLKVRVAPTDTTAPVNREFFLYSVEKGLAYEKITCSGSYNYIRNKMVDNVMDSTWGKTTWLQSLDPYRQNILLGFVQSASVEMYRRWVMDGKKIPLEEIIEISNQLLCSGVNGFVRKNIPI